MGAIVEAEVTDLRVRLSNEYGIDFAIEVASDAEQEWHHLPEIFLLLDGVPFSRGATSVGKNFEHLRNACERLARDLERVRMLLDKDHLADTQRRLAAIRQQVVEPLVNMSKK